MKLLKIETKLQEILLVLLFVAFPLFSFSLLIHFNIDSTRSQEFFGSFGSNFLKQGFAIFGWAFFYAPLLCLFLGLEGIRRGQNVGQFIKFWKDYIFIGLTQFVYIVALSSSVGVLKVDHHWSMVTSGELGNQIGLALHQSLGLLGSFTFIILAMLLASISFGKFSVVQSIFLMKESLEWMIQKSAESFIVVKERIQQYQKNREEYRLARATLEVPALPQDFHAPKVVNLLEPAFVPHSQARTAYPSQIKLIVDGHTLVQRRDDILQPKLLPSVNSNDVPMTPGELLTDGKKSPAKKKTRKKKDAAAETEMADVEVDTKKAPTSDKIVAAPKEASKGAADSPAEGSEFNIALEPFKKRYHQPAKELLEKRAFPKTTDKKTLEKKSTMLEDRLRSFSINGKVTAVHPGIRLTMFEYTPDSGMKLSKIQALTQDLALLLGAPSIRVLAPIPGKTSVGFEIPNEDSSPLGFIHLLEELKKNKKMELPVGLGMDVYNNTLLADLSAMPHLLVSGTTGSGKSVFMNSLIMSLLYTRSPADMRMIMIDPKMIELTPYNGIPHLALPVISDLDKARDALVWAEREMDARYQLFSETGARNIASFNEMIEKQSKQSIERRLSKKLSLNWEKMPYLVIIVDELADLMITQGKLVEIPITRIAQKARACGIHLVLSTQRPSAEIVTGLIKTNFPTRISFKVSSSIDSRTILDTSGAEALLGNGDMLYKTSGKPLERIQSAFITEDEVRTVVDEIKSQHKK